MGTAIAQVPRGESAETLNQDMESPLGALMIFAAVAVIAAFKQSWVDGIKALGFCTAVALLFLFLPKVGMAIAGVLAVIIGVGLFWSFM